MIGLGLDSTGFALGYVEVGEGRRFILASGHVCGLGWVNVMVGRAGKELSLHTIIIFTWWCLSLVVMASWVENAPSPVVHLRH